MKIFTESEVLGIDYVVPHILWTRYLLEVQEMTTNKKNVYQDYHSVIQIDMDGRLSSSKLT